MNEKDSVAMTFFLILLGFKLYHVHPGRNKVLKTAAATVSQMFFLLLLKEFPRRSQFKLVAFNT